MDWKQALLWGWACFFNCLSDTFHWHRCLSIVSTDHLTTYESLYFMLCVTRFKEKDSSDITKVFQKGICPVVKEVPVVLCTHIVGFSHH